MRKLSVKISLAIFVVLIIGLVVLYSVTTMNVRKMATGSIQEKMDDAVASRVTLVEEYISGFEKNTITWAQTDIFKLCCKQRAGTLKEGDPLYNYRAEEIAEEFLCLIKKNVDNEAYEGVWAADSETKVFAHSTPEAVGVILREDKKDQQALLDSLKDIPDDQILNMGVRKSTASGEMLLACYYPIRDDDTSVIGVTGFGVRMKPLIDIFDAHPISGMENAIYQMIDLDHKQYIFNSEDPTTVGAETTGAELEFIADVTRDRVLPTTLESDHDEVMKQYPRH